MLLRIRLPLFPPPALSIRSQDGCGKGKGFPSFPAARPLHTGTHRSTEAWGDSALE